MDDSGDVIFCVVQNSFGSDTSNPAILHVYAPNAPQVTAPGDYSTVWTWNLPEGAVEFRYQLDSTNNDKWTTVKKTVRSYTLPKNVSGTHTFFVQCRGERGGWSYTGSATATIDPAIFAPPIILCTQPIRSSKWKNCHVYYRASRPPLSEKTPDY